MGRPAARSMGKPTVKGLSTSNRWSTLALLGEDESALQRDWLSNLPDDLLLNIIERLDVADATRTSILSRRWKQIPTMLSKIVIMVGSADNAQERTCDAARANATVLGATRSLLESRGTSPYTIHHLCMQFFLGNGSIEIGQAVAKTIATHKVAFAEFTILTEKELARCSPGYMLAYGWQLKSLHDPLSFGYVPLLHSVSISNTALSWHKVLKLSEFLGKATVSNLHLGFESERIWVKPEDPRELLQVFSKLRLVNLAAISEECDLTWTLFVLQGAPSLEELCIRVCDCLKIWDEEERKKLAYSEERKDVDAKWEGFDFKHRKLTVLRIFGFQLEVKFVVISQLSWKQQSISKTYTCMRSQRARRSVNTSASEVTDSRSQGGRRCWLGAV